jgi:NADH-quinone oxidoreductase subunit J
VESVKIDMVMSLLLFYIFALVTLGFGVVVITAKTPVTNAVSLAVSFVGIAALFVSLDAPFLGVIQILVYAGAVMVLFLFIIMLLDIHFDEFKKVNAVSVLGSLLVGMILAVQLSYVVSDWKGENLNEKTLNFNQAQGTSYAKLKTINQDLTKGELPDAKILGVTLFRDYGLHLQMVGLLLLVGTIGVVTLSKKEETMIK